MPVRVRPPAKNKMDIDYLCELAHIKLKEHEKQIIANDIQKIIHFFDKIQELNLEKEEYYYPSHLKETIFNEDKINQIDFSEFIEKNSVKEQNYFKIPPIHKEVSNEKGREGRNNQINTTTW